MDFINLDKLCIDKNETNFKNQTFIIKNIDLDSCSLGELKAAVDTAFGAAKELEPTDEAVLYKVEFSSTHFRTTKKEACNFISIVNVTLAELFNYLIITTETRKREHRLDVPEKLRGANMNWSLLKKAVNQETNVNRFNVIITYGDLIYNLVPEEVEA